jgi:hypothetical protein
MIGFFMRFSIILVLLLCSSFCASQNTEVRGTVIDKNSREPVAFAAIQLKGTTATAVSDENGEYAIVSAQASDSLIVMLVGYKTSSYFIKRNNKQRLDIEIEAANYSLGEILIRPGRNPAFRIMDNVIAHKAEHRSNSNVNSYDWEVYEKFQIYFGNYSQKFRDKKQFSEYKFIFDHADSSSGKPMLPIYMSEKISHEFLSDSIPGKKASVLLAEKRTGETYEQLTSIADKMVENINIYEDFFIILDKSFISPINNNYQLYYKYYLEDSLFIGDQRCFRIRFVPKWKEDLAFSGEMLVHDSTWAIKNIHFNINNEINLNYVKDFWIKQDFVRVQNKWLQKKFETSATISPLKRKKSEEFTVHRTTSLKSFTVDEPGKTALKFFSHSGSETTVKSEEYWNHARHDSLTTKESFSYMIADTLNYVPAVKKVKKAAIVFASGYLEFGKIGIGQIHTFYSFNPVEQDRYKLGLRTTKELSKKFQLEGYGAYGSSDEIFKYKASALYVPIKDKGRLSLGAAYMYDIQQMGISPNHIQFDNILTSLTRTSNLSRLSYNREASAFIEKYWLDGLATTLSFTASEIRTAGDWKFEKLISSEANVIQQYNTLGRTEFKLNTRFSFNEDFLNSEFKRTSLGSRYPIIDLTYTVSFKDLLLADYSYQKLKLRLKGKLRFNPLGFTQYSVEGGKIFGNVPYVFAELHPGNQTLVYDAEAFNLMRYFEFASDEFVSVHLDHHFEGFFLNKVPALKKAQLREVISARAVAGNLSSNTRDELLLPSGLSDVSEPYVECSAGLENIFKVVRIDYIWRLTHKSMFQEDNWSIKAKFYFTF